jgi:hypothetical protein
MILTRIGVRVVEVLAVKAFVSMLKVQTIKVSTDSKLMFIIVLTAMSTFIPVVSKVSIVFITTFVFIINFMRSRITDISMTFAWAIIVLLRVIIITTMSTMITTIIVITIIIATIIVNVTTIITTIIVAQIIATIIVLCANNGKSSQEEQRGSSELREHLCNYF